MITVRIAELKARLSDYLRRVRRGEVVTVLDRQTPVAQIVPYRNESVSLTIRPALPGARLHEVPIPPPLETGVDAVALLEDRGAR
jgi:prevent-host-death family protein